MLDGVLYRVVAELLNLNVWGGELVGADGLPDRGAAVYVANHAGSLGPIAVTSSLPFRVYPWVVGDMMDWQKAAAYLERDFVQSDLHLRPPFSGFLSRLITQVSVRLLCGIQCVPVWQGERILETYHISAADLQDGKPLLIFPEDPQLAADSVLGMRPFKQGFARLGQVYYERTHEALRFYPLAVHARRRQVRVGPAVAFNPHNAPVRERSRITALLESAIRNMLLDMDLQEYAGIPLPH